MYRFLKNDAFSDKTSFVARQNFRSLAIDSNCKIVMIDIESIAPASCYKVRAVPFLMFVLNLIVVV